MAATAIAVLVLALVALGCGDNGDGNGGGAGAYGGGAGANGGERAEGTTSPSAGGPAVVSVADNPKLGEILVDSQGRTLYLFEKDKGGESACYGACASTWPPLATSGEPKAQDGAEASMLGTTKRTDGSEQVTYNGFPLYTYEGDKKPGDVTGNDFEQFGAEWYALTPEGEKPED